MMICKELQKVRTLNCRKGRSRRIGVKLRKLTTSNASNVDAYARYGRIKLWSEVQGF